MSFKTLLEEAEKYTERIKNIDNLVFSGNPGVYLIHKNQKVIYVGQSENLKKRFKKHLSKSKSTKGSTLRRILVRKYDDVEPQGTRNWIVNNCSISVIELDDDATDLRYRYDMCKLVESLLIAHFRNESNDLLNS